MKGNKRIKCIMLIVAALALAILFLFACNDLTLNEELPADLAKMISTTEKDTSEASPAETTDNEPHENTEISEQNEPREGTEYVTEESAKSDTVNQGETTESGTVTTGETEQTQNGTTSDETQTNETQSSEPTTESEESSESIDGYTRVTALRALSRTIVVHDRELGSATITADGYLLTDAFTESPIELWQKGEKLYLYFETLDGFREISFHRALPIVQIDLTAEELSVLTPAPADDSEQAEQSEGESQDGESSEETLSNGSDQGEEQTKEEQVGSNGESQGEEQGVESENTQNDEENEQGESDETPDVGESNEGAQQSEEGAHQHEETDEQDVEGEPSVGENEQQNEQQEEPFGDQGSDNQEQGETPQPPDSNEQSGEPEEQSSNPNEQTPTPDLQNGESEEETQNAGEQGGGANEQNGENENGGEQTPKEEEGQQGDALTCPVCGVLLEETAVHSEECVNGATFPEGSAAYDFLNALPGVREHLDVTVIDEESEIYSIELNYLSVQGVSAVDSLMAACGGAPTHRGDGTTEYSGQKVIGEKYFTFDVAVTPVSNYCNAIILVRGFALE